MGYESKIDSLLANVRSAGESTLWWGRKVVHFVVRRFSEDVDIVGDQRASGPSQTTDLGPATKKFLGVVDNRSDDQKPPPAEDPLVDRLNERGIPPDATRHPD